MSLTFDAGGDGAIFESRRRVFPRTVSFFAVQTHYKISIASLVYLLQNYNTCLDSSLQALLISLNIRFVTCRFYFPEMSVSGMFW